MSGEESFSLAPNVKLRLYSFVRPDKALSDCKAILLFHHGLGDHAMRYEEVASALFERIPTLDAFLTYDARGHGRSAPNKKFCQVEGIDQLSNDFGEVLTKHWLKVCNPDARFIISGHSMGGLVIATAAADAKHAVNGEARDRILGTFLSAPALGVVVNGMANKILAPFAKPVNRIPGARGIVKENGIIVEALTRDVEEQKKYEEDEYTHSLTSFGLGGDFLHHGNMISSRISENRSTPLVLRDAPLLITYGGDEKVVDARAGSRLLTALKSEKANIVTIPEARHEVFLDLPESREAFYKEVGGFCENCFA